MFTKIDHIKLHYKVIGAGPTILLLHGWGLNLESLKNVAKALSNMNYQVISLDFPGFGLSDPPPSAWDVGDFAELIYKFIQFRNLKQVDILAHSFGGRVAIKLATKEISKDCIGSMILTGCAGILPSNPIGKLLKSISNRMPFLESLLRSNPFFENVLINILGSEDYKNAGELRETFKLIVSEDLEPLLMHIKSKTLLIWGGSDDVTPLADGKKMYHKIPNATLEVISNTGHFCFIDEFEEFMKIIEKFIWVDEGEGNA